MITLGGKMISSEIATRLNISGRLKVVVGTQDKPRIAVVAENKLFGTCMALFRGYAISPDLTKAERVVVKISPRREDDQKLIMETGFIERFEDVPGFPNTIKQGKIRMRESGDKWRWSPYFAMSEIEGKTLDKMKLDNWQRKTPSRESLAKLSGVVLAGFADRLADAHERGILHRDVKPGNAIYSENNGVSLIDFGSADHLDASGVRNDLTTFGFYPPELQTAQTQEARIKTDIYGFGISCFVVLSGEKGLVYQGMADPFNQSGMSFMFNAVSRQTLVDIYYQQILANVECNEAAVLQKCNMPAELKETSLGKYLVRLFHPNNALRPDNMRLVAEEMRRLGSELETIELRGSPK